MGNKIDKMGNRGSSGKNNTKKDTQVKTRDRSYGLKILQKASYIIYFVGLFFGLVLLLLTLWPSAASKEAATTVQNVQLGPLSIKFTEDVRFILIVAVMGALGGCAYSAKSFAGHVGKGTFKTSYTCWYILRPVIGSILAVIFYFAFHAAFLSFSASPEDLNIFGIATLGGIVGIFSQETMDKLKELFDRILPTDQGA